MIIAAIAIVHPKMTPDRTTAWSLASLAKTFLKSPRLKRVQALFRAELKLERIAPIIAAAQKPVSGPGRVR